MSLREAVDLIKIGKKEDARKILVGILEADPDNEGAWLWLTKTGIPDARKIKCFRRVLEINPDNDKARQSLEALESKPERDPLLEEFAVTPDVVTETPPVKRKTSPMAYMVGSTFLCLAGFPLSFIFRDAAAMFGCFLLAVIVLLIGLASGEVKFLG